MKLKYSISILAFSAIFFVASCVEEISFDASKTVADTIVVSGNFTNSHDIQRVFITKPNAFGNAGFAAVQDAKVWVIDENNNRAEYLPAIGKTVNDPDFCYELPAGAMIGEPGKVYFLEIQLKDGRIYQSKPDEMPPLVEADSMSAKGVFVNSGTPVEPGEKLPHVSLDVNTTIPADVNSCFLRWDIHRVFLLQQFFADPVPPKTQTHCFVHDLFSKQNVFIQKFENNGGQKFSKNMALRYLDKTYFNITYFTLTQHSITKDAYRYWEQVAKVANPNGTIFDPPPSPVRGNLFNVNDLDEIPLGYFEVAAVDTARYRLNTTDLGTDFAPPQYCDRAQSYYHFQGEECDCCILLAFSQYEKPWYWKL